MRVLIASVCNRYRYIVVAAGKKSIAITARPARAGKADVEIIFWWMDCRCLRKMTVGEIDAISSVLDVITRSFSCNGITVLSLSTDLFP